MRPLEWPVFRAFCFPSARPETVRRPREAVHFCARPVQHCLNAVAQCSASMHSSPMQYCSNATEQCTSGVHTVERNKKVMVASDLARPAASLLLLRPSGPKSIRLLGQNIAPLAPTAKPASQTHTHTMGPNLGLGAVYAAHVVSSSSAARQRRRSSPARPQTNHLAPQAGHQVRFRRPPQAPARQLAEAQPRRARRWRALFADVLEARQSSIWAHNSQPKSRVSSRADLQPRASGQPDRIETRWGALSAGRRQARAPHGHPLPIATRSPWPVAIQLDCLQFGPGRPELRPRSFAYHSPAHTAAIIAALISQPHTVLAPLSSPPNLALKAHF